MDVSVPKHFPEVIPSTRTGGETPPVSTPMQPCAGDKRLQCWDLHHAPCIKPPSEHRPYWPTTRSC